MFENFIAEYTDQKKYLTNRTFNKWCKKYAEYNGKEYVDGSSNGARWFEMAKWIKDGGALPRDRELAEELIAATYTFQGDKFRLCDKDDIKDLIGRSPDKADALALTFAYPVSPSLAHIHPSLGQMAAAVTEYDPLQSA